MAIKLPAYLKSWKLNKNLKKQGFQRIVKHGQHPNQIKCLCFHQNHPVTVHHNTEQGWGKNAALPYTRRTTWIWAIAFHQCKHMLQYSGAGLLLGRAEYLVCLWSILPFCAVQKVASGQEWQWWWTDRSKLIVACMLSTGWVGCVQGGGS